MTVRLTGPDKNAIRNRPCGRCGAVPPFPDGSRCHPHRLVPSRGYVAGNVVARCPPCHSEEPGHKPWVRHARQGGLIGGPIGGPIGGRRVHELHPDLNAILNARRTPAQKSAIGRSGGLATYARMTPAQRSAKGRGLRASLTPAQLSANGRKSTHSRWHTARGITNPVCALCRAESRAA